MLRPENRNLLLEAMRPPPGYSFDHAIGTTFTLDLLSLLVTPLAFTFFDWEDREGRPTAEPLALLEALRRHAGNIHLFCQAGMINVPPSDKGLLPFLEDSVFAVRPPNKGGLFHPKIWLLRFTSDEEPTMYRLMCLSRNLTFARSWDTVLVLDGVLTERKRAFSKNHPLGEFIEALPAMALRDVGDDVDEVVAQMAHEVRRVAFEPPEGFKDFRFWPVGLDRRYAWPFPGDQRPFLVMSPFLGDSFLQKIQLDGHLKYVISRPESFAQLSVASLADVGDCLVMNDGSALDATDGDAESTPDETDDNELAGLHAKLFVMDDGWDARIWTGSANATHAAFNSNIEFLVELTGLKGRCGIKALLGGDDDQHTLRALLAPYDRDDDEASEDGDDEARRYLDAARQKLIDLELEAHVAAVDENQFSISVRCPGRSRWRPPQDVAVEVWPVTLQHSVELAAGVATAATFEGVSLEAISAFFAFEVAVAAGSSAVGGTVRPLRFVLRLPLHGAPPERKDRILQSLLKDQDQVMRLLLLLLAGDSMSVSDFAMDGGPASIGAATSFGAFDTTTLLESLLRALDRDPTALEQVASIVADLKKTPEGQQLIPNGFDEIWAPIWECYSEGQE